MNVKLKIFLLQEEEIIEIYCWISYLWMCFFLIVVVKKEKVDFLWRLSLRCVSISVIEFILILRFKDKSNVDGNRTDWVNDWLTECLKRLSLESMEFRFALRRKKIQFSRNSNLKAKNVRSLSIHSIENHIHI